MAEKAVPGEGILVAEHHLHHRLILGVRMVVHADDRRFREQISWTLILASRSPQNCRAPDTYLPSVGTSSPPGIPQAAPRIPQRFQRLAHLFQP